MKRGQVDRQPRSLEKMFKKLIEIEKLIEKAEELHMVVRVGAAQTDRWTGRPPGGLVPICDRKMRHLMRRLDDAAPQTAARTLDFLTFKNLSMLPHPPHSLDSVL
ncbi:hypothetical protein EVAR_77559_1 [Eumeta japonica]|uniref:Uncharacterized protein n=1 Tax=Eumeta variegata TaxID=151549 RepID=A0A4C1T9Q2_EUMVA|nr:hypothetical protein EVAR_77559_1 [Eumeta japonica]